jgi:RHS repeat-associated protein
VWRWDPDAFGTALPSIATIAYNLRFSGQYYQTETGLMYNYFRDYDPRTGSYVESDPIGLAGGQVSTYAYVQGNPISEVDPFGMSGWPWGSISPAEAQSLSLQQQLSYVASQAWNYLTGNIGLNAGYHQGPLGNSIEVGGALGGNGAVCGYVTQCSTAGWGHMAAVGIGGGATLGPKACTGVTPSAGVFGVAGDGIVGGGQSTIGQDGSTAGSVSFRSLFGGGAAAGGIACVQYMKCL